MKKVFLLLFLLAVLFVIAVTVVYWVAEAEAAFCDRCTPCPTAPGLIKQCQKRCDLCWEEEPTFRIFLPLVIK